MRYDLLVVIGAVLIAVGGAVPAGAVPLAFDLTGPSGTAAFQLDSNPIPDFYSSFLGSDQFGFKNVAGTFGGKPGVASIISFGNGFFSVLNVTAPNLGFTQFIAPTLFSGSANAPVFATGTFTLINPFFGNADLTISQVQSAVPEPATWALMVAGYGFLGTMLRYRRRETSVELA